MAHTFESKADEMTQAASDTLRETVHDPKWQHIPLKALIETNKLIFIPGSASVEEAFNTLAKNHLNSIPVEAVPGDMNCLTFDYNDLNSYLLLVLNKIQVNNQKVTEDCQNGKPVPVGEIVKLTPKNPFYKLSENDILTSAMRILGSGVHRVAICNPEMTFVKGILSQRRLVKYLWNNAKQFASLESLFNYSLQDLQIGVLNSQYKVTSRQSRVISIHGEEPLIMALYKMYTERISSIAVVDNQYNLLGNISVADVKHVTRTSQYPLLHKTCRHFISVILNSRGLETGKDSFPVFHVYPTSSLGRTLAKLVATKSHRLWIVQPPESLLSAQSTGNSMTNISINSATTNLSNSPTNNITLPTESQQLPQLTPTVSNSSNNNPSSPNLFEKEYRSGKLIGVISLTDIISLFVRMATNNKEVDPQTARRQRGSIV
ncbi:protein Sds24p [Monosporozyma servazzii]